MSIAFSGVTFSMSNIQIQLGKSTSIAVTDNIRVVATAVLDKRESGQLTGLLGNI